LASATEGAGSATIARCDTEHFHKRSMCGARPVRSSSFFFHRFLGALAKERAQIGTDMANMAEEFVIFIRSQLDGDADRAP
jgi:hypothetical protein